MYLGRYPLGKTVGLWLQCVDANKVAALPTNPPNVRILNGTTLVKATTMALQDRYQQTGWFYYPLFLGTGFSTGLHQVVFHYRVSTTYGLEVANLEVVGSGHQDGAVTDMYFLERPHASFVVQALGETGQIIKGRNPQVR